MLNLVVHKGTTDSTAQQQRKIKTFVVALQPFWLLGVTCKHDIGIERSVYHFLQYTRVVPKVMSNFFLHANWERQTKESEVVDGTSRCVILECLVTPVACIT